MKVSIIVPFLNEANSLKKMNERAQEVRDSFVDADVDFIFVDDGSNDGSAEILSDLKISNSKVIQFSKNYGSHYALMAGIRESDSDYVTFMSSDGQEPLDLFFKLFLKAKTESFQIVFGLREKRATSFFQGIFSSFYNKLVSRFAFSGFPEGGVDVFLISRNLAQILKKTPEKNTSLYGLLFNMGFKKGFVSYRQLPRGEGQSKWTFTKKTKLFLDTFVSFTVLPLRLITVLGGVFSVLGFLYGVIVIFLYFQGKIALLGFPTLVSLMTFGFGLVFLMIGILSEYLWRIFDQIRPRPVFVIQRKIEFGKNGEFKDSTEVDWVSS